jgi:thiamine pyrophosphokinase
MLFHKNNNQAAMPKSNSSAFKRNSINPTIVIFANGVSKHLEMHRSDVAQADFIICANGGTEACLRLGFSPNLVVGDLDSLAAETMELLHKNNVEIVAHPIDKNQTDLELALQEAASRQPKSILVLNAMGGRLDQLLANIFLLASQELASIPITLADGNQSVYPLCESQEFRLNGQPGDTLSLIVLSERAQGITLDGVKWPLKNTILSFGSTLPLSNRFLGKTINLQMKKGIIFVIHISHSSEEAFL